MKRLFIHIGFHKTGTTAIQNSLVSNKTKLQSMKWDFIHTDKSGNMSSHIGIQGKDSDMLDFKVKESFFDAIKESSKENVIVSAEYLSFIDSYYEINKIKEKLSDFYSEIKILIYLRRQDQLALSFKQQASKVVTKGSMPSSLIFKHSKAALPELSQEVVRYLSFHKKVSIWSKVFGNESIIISDFNRDTLEGGDICKDFIKKLNLKIELESQQVNDGVSRRLSLFLHSFIDMNAPAKILSYLRESIKYDKKIIPSRSEMRDFYSVFTEDNKKIVEQFPSFKGFNENFDSYSEKSEYFLNNIDWEWFEKEFINKRITSSEIDLIRDSAIALEEVDANASYQLFKLAKRLRPDGKLINRKLIDTTYKASKLKGYKILDQKERIKYYFSGNQDSINKIDFPKDKVVIDSPMFYKFEMLKSEKGIGGSYRKDMDTILSAVNIKDQYLPVLFGDTLLNEKLSVFVKTRSIKNPNGILLKLNHSRHWQIEKCLSYDIPWDEKKTNIVWRGATTGYEVGKDNPRINFVKQYFSKFNIGFSKIVQGKETYKKYLLETLTFKDQLEYKFIVSIEGNDVATNLKWILASNSVPIMAVPTKEGWLMEGRLIPFYHYLPINEDLSNLNEIFKWAKDNDELCEVIAENGKQYMKQFSNTSIEDELQNELVKNYFDN